MMRPRAVVMALAIALAAVTAACTDGIRDIGVATGPSPGPAATASATPDPRRFAACLRERGLEVPDPPPGEQVEIRDKDDDTRAALRACARYAPPRQEEERTIDPAAARAYAACIRDQGFPDFPDPDAGGPRIPKDLIDDERFEAADRECAPLLNDGKGDKQ